MYKHRNIIFRVWVILTILINEGMIGANGQEDDDPDLNVLLTKIQDFQEESRNMNNHILKKISELKGSIPKPTEKIAVLQPGDSAQAQKSKVPDEDALNKVFTKMEKRLNQINSISLATQTSNKAVMDLLSKNKGQNVMSNQATVLPNDVKKEIAEKISAEFIQMREWIANTIDRLSGMEKKCASLAVNMENTKNQCIQKLGEQVQNSGLEDFKEEVRQNFSRVERDLKNELEKMVQNMDWKVTVPAAAPESTKTTEKILPTFPPTIPPRFPVDIPCNSKVFYKTPQNCEEVKNKGGATCDGTYVIYPQKRKAVVTVCDMTTLDGGWTVIMRRGKIPQSNFHQTWSAYKKGFGRTKGELWLGNEHVHLLTSSRTQNINSSQELLLQLESFQGEQLNLLFDFIYLEDEQHNYKLHLGNVSGNFKSLASPFSLLNNRIFRTYDRNQGEEDCAQRHRGGWWFDGSCDDAASVLTSPLYDENDFREHWKGIRWPTWQGDSVLKSAEMKIRTKKMQE